MTDSRSTENAAPGGTCAAAGSVWAVYWPQTNSLPSANIACAPWLFRTKQAALDHQKTFHPGGSGFVIEQITISTPNAQGHTLARSAAEGQ